MNIKILITLLSLALLFVSLKTNAEIITYEREYTYKASDADSKISARAISLEQLKILLLEEIGVNIKSELNISESSNSKAFGKRSITAITAGLAKTVVLDEKWDGSKYYIKARISVDTKNVLESIKTLQSEQSDVIAINKHSAQVSDALDKNNAIRQQLKKTANESDKQKLYAEYKSNIETIIANNNSLNKHINCTFPDTPDTTAPSWLCGEPLTPTGHSDHPFITAIGSSPPLGNHTSMKRTAAEDAVDNLKLKIFRHMKDIVYGYYKKNNLTINELKIDDTIESYLRSNKIQGKRIYRTRTSPNGSLYIILGVQKSSLEFYTRRLIMSLY